MSPAYGTTQCSVIDVARGCECVCCTALFSVLRSAVSPPLIHITLKCYLSAMNSETAADLVIENPNACDTICSAFVCTDEACREVVLKILSVIA